MTFRSIIRKNFLFNVKKYVSLYFVNTLIVAILFMFGSLLYNPDILGQVGDSTLYDIVRLSLIGVVLFSVVFVTYSNLSFLKYRGREFGMYITLGMTTRDLSKLLLLENLGVAAVSLASGLISGVVFGKLFYMGINQILLVNKLQFGPNAGSLLLGSGIFLVIALLNAGFNLIYIRRMAVVRILKSAHVREAGEHRPGWGMLALILFTVSAVLLPVTLLNNGFGGSKALVGVFAVLTLVCPYMIIGTGVSTAKSVAKRFRRFYNNNLLVMANLSHRMASYTTTLYIVTLLIAGAMFFIGLTYTLYATTRETIQRNTPYDVLFVESGPVNVISEAEIAALFTGSGDRLERNETLEYVAIPEFREDQGAWELWDTQSMVIGESAFNRLLGTDYALGESQALNARVRQAHKKVNIPDTILATIPPEQAEKKIPEVSGMKEPLLQAMQGAVIQKYRAADIVAVTQPFMNSVEMASSAFGEAMVVDDAVYERLKAAALAAQAGQVKKVHLLSGNLSDTGFAALLDNLRNRNGYDATYWTTPYRQHLNAEDPTRAEEEEMRPVFRGELLSRELEANGVKFFIIMFLGALFIAAAGLVLVHKVWSEIDAQKESMISLKRLGVTPKELRQLAAKELAIVFMLPAVGGLGLGLYYFFVLLSGTYGLAGPLGRASLIALIFLVMQTAFYFTSRRRYFAELGML